jgi:hypothetical protein
MLPSHRVAPLSGPRGFMVGCSRFTAATQEMLVAKAPSHPPKGSVRTIALLVSVALAPETPSRTLLPALCSRPYSALGMVR